MTKKIEAWVKEGRDVYRATSDDTRREFYENTFLFNEFNESFSERYRLIEKSGSYFLAAQRGSWEGSSRDYSELFKIPFDSGVPVWKYTASAKIDLVYLDRSERAIIAAGNFLEVIDKDANRIFPILDFGNTIKDIAHDDDLNIVVATSDGSRGTVNKIDDSGNIVWSRSKDSGGGDYRTPFSIDVLSTGHIVLVADGGSVGVALGISPDGSTWVYTEDYIDLLTWSTYIAGVKVGPDDSIYLFEDPRF